MQEKKVTRKQINSTLKQQMYPNLKRISFLTSLNKKIRIGLINISVIISLLSFTGCVHHLELSDHLIIQAVGLDFEDGLYKVAAQYYTGQGGGGEKSSSELTMYTAMGEGASVAGAMHEAGFNAGRPLLMGECQVFIIGEGLREKNLFDILNTLTNEYKSYSKIAVCASAGKASDILKVKYKDENISLHRLHRMLRNAEDSGLCPISYLSTVMKDSLSLLGCAYLPLLDVTDIESDSTEDGKVVEIVGSALAKNNEYKTYIGLAETSGILWLKNANSNASITIVYDEKPVMVNLFNMKSKMEPSMENGQIIVNVSCEALIGYFETHVPDSTHEKNDILRDLTEKAITERMTNTLKVVVLEYGIDVIDLEETIRHRDYRLWTKIEDDWENAIKNIEFRVTTNVDVSRYNKI